MAALLELTYRVNAIPIEVSFRNWQAGPKIPMET